MKRKTVRRTNRKPNPPSMGAYLDAVNAAMKAGAYAGDKLRISFRHPSIHTIADYAEAELKVQTLNAEANRIWTLIERAAMARRP